MAGRAEVKTTLVLSCQSATALGPSMPQSLLLISPSGWVVGRPWPMVDFPKIGGARVSN